MASFVKGFGERNSRFSSENLVLEIVYSFARFIQERLWPSHLKREKLDYSLDKKVKVCVAAEQAKGNGRQLDS
jgi:hypothetical protein